MGVVDDVLPPPRRPTFRAGFDVALCGRSLFPARHRYHHHHAAKAIAEISPMQYHECLVTYPNHPVELSWRRTSRRDPVSTRLIEAFSERLALKL